MPNASVKLDIEPFPPCNMLLATTELSNMGLLELEMPSTMQ